MSSCWSTVSLGSRGWHSLYSLSPIAEGLIGLLITSSSPENNPSATNLPLTSRVVIEGARLSVTFKVKAEHSLTTDLKFEILFL